MDTSTKRCKDCGEHKSLSDFRPEKRNKDGLAGRCAACASAKSAAYYQANKDRVLAAVKARYEAKKDDIKAYKQGWQARNREALKAKRRADYLSRPGHYKAKAQAWYQMNHARALQYRRDHRRLRGDQYRAAKHRRRALEKAAGGTFTADDVRQLLALQRGRCAACRKKLGRGFHVDHIHPLARGGRNDRPNLQLLCPHCNRSKGAMHPGDFMAKKGFLL